MELKCLKVITAGNYMLKNNNRNNRNTLTLGENKGVTNNYKNLYGKFVWFCEPWNEQWKETKELTETGSLPGRTQNQAVPLLGSIK